MLQNAYLVAKIGADTAENEQHSAEILPTDERLNFWSISSDGRVSNWRLMKNRIESEENFELKLQGAGEVSSRKKHKGSREPRSVYFHHFFVLFIITFSRVRRQIRKDHDCSAVKMNNRNCPPCGRTSNYRKSWAFFHLLLSRLCNRLARRTKRQSLAWPAGSASISTKPWSPQAGFMAVRDFDEKGKYEKGSTGS